jgi:putative transposase
VYAAVEQLVLGSGNSVSQVCQTLSVSRSGFYAWRSAAETAREQRDAELTPLVSEIFWKHKRRYGARRIAVELSERGERCGVVRVAKLLERQSLQAIQPKSYRPRTTDARHGLGYSPNLLSGRESPKRMNTVWVGDITYVPLTSAGFGYLSLLMDLYSRRIVGWEFSESMTDSLVLSALRSAIERRQPPSGLIHHSDRGSQYASSRYRQVLRRASMRQSMSAAGNCYDNAFMESCFGTLKSELEMAEYRDRMEAIRELSEYVRYYNVDRRHSSLGYLTPSSFESQSIVRK